MRVVSATPEIRTLEYAGQTVADSTTQWFGDLVTVGTTRVDVFVLSDRIVNVLVRFTSGARGIQYVPASALGITVASAGFGASYTGPVGQLLEVGIENTSGSSAIVSLWAVAR